MQEHVLEYIRQNQMVQKGDHIIVGVSGGADSVCLFYILQQLQEKASFTMAVVHINHGIRGDEAKADEEFTRQLAKRYDVPYKSVAFDVTKEAQKRGMSIEEAGRIIRRETFEQFAKEDGANKIALGHHRDDQAETVIFNLVRGSGIGGLCGIHPVRGQYIRPLLAVSKVEIEDYLKRYNLVWRIDATNQSENYTRNKIRHNIIKYLEEINPQAQDHMAASARHLQEVEAYLAPQVKEIYKRFTKNLSEGIFIAQELLGEDVFMQKSVMREAVKETVGSLKDFNRKNIESMTTIFGKEVGKQIEVGKGFVLKRTYCGAILELAKQDGDKAKVVVAVPIPGECQWGKERFTCRVIEAKGEPLVEQTYTKRFDYDKITGPLVLRNRQRGDVIVTCEGGGKKKLKDYFIDAKISREKRDELVLLATKGEILWIVGDRISEKYRVSKDTKQILIISEEGEGMA